MDEPKTVKAEKELPRGVVNWRLEFKKTREIVNQVGFYRVLLILVTVMLFFFALTTHAFATTLLIAIPAGVITALIFIGLIGVMGLMIRAIIRAEEIKEKKMGWNCPYQKADEEGGQCGKYIRSTETWQCRRCNHINDKLAFLEHSFLDICAECKQEPTAYLCPHCLRTIFLDETMSELGCAAHPEARKAREAQDIAKAAQRKFDEEAKAREAARRAKDVGPNDKIAELGKALLGDALSKRLTEQEIVEKARAANLPKAEIKRLLESFRHKTWD